MCLPCQANANAYMNEFMEKYSNDPSVIIRVNWAFFSLENQPETVDHSDQAKRYFSPSELREIMEQKWEPLFQY